MPSIQAHELQRELSEAETTLSANVPLSTRMLIGISLGEAAALGADLTIGSSRTRLQADM